jgi:hypothetical protein
MEYERFYSSNNLTTFKVPSPRPRNNPRIAKEVIQPGGWEINRSVDQR